MNNNGPSGLVSGRHLLDFLVFQGDLWSEIMANNNNHNNMGKNQPAGQHLLIQSFIHSFIVNRSAVERLAGGSLASILSKTHDVWTQQVVLMREAKAVAFAADLAGTLSHACWQARAGDCLDSAGCKVKATRAMNSADGATSWRRELPLESRRLELDLDLDPSPKSELELAKRLCSARLGQTRLDSTRLRRRKGSSPRLISFDWAQLGLAGRQAAFN